MFLQETNTDTLIAFKLTQFGKIVGLSIEGTTVGTHNIYVMYIVSRTYPKGCTSYDPY